MTGASTGASVDWAPDGAPRSRLFDDVYFSRAGGLEESRAVFLAGCGLPDGWKGRRRFVVGELGFGTGLNVLALLDLWRRERPPDARLNVFSIEAHPLAAEDAARALAAWPRMADLARSLLDRWPTARGFHRLDFPDLNAVLDLAVMEAAESLQAWDGRADAWFLDGFSPAKNPQMWRDEVLGLVAARSAPGARAATYTVAGAVRRGLEAQGFAVSKRPGFGGKAERLEAVLADGLSLPDEPPRRIAIVGAGIAGASIARALRAEGIDPVVVDADPPGGGASGNPSALVTPRFDAGGGPVAALFAQAFERAVTLYVQEAPGSLIARGALQLETQARDVRRFDRIAGSELFEPGALTRLSAEDASERLGEPVNAGGLWIRDALVVEPAAILAAWLNGCEVVQAQVSRIEPGGGAWRLMDADGQMILEADAVIVAAGFGAARLLPGLPFQPVRGQASFADWPDRPVPAAWGGYVIPTRGGVLFGATHDRDDTGDETRTEDHVRNLALLAQRRPALAAALAETPLAGRAALRAATADHLPLAGPAIGAPSGLHILGGLGGRGFALAPLLGEHLAAAVLGAPSPLPGPLAAAVDPQRFQPPFSEGRPN
jgi:tRNA 5-methylaminomethyl-2-thiouridine biosynthesis bifunctional protein